MSKLRSEKNPLWLLNEEVARVLAYAFRDRDDVELFAGIQREGQLAAYYNQYMLNKLQTQGFLGGQVKRLVSYHLKNENHFVLTAYDLEKQQVLYFDPLGGGLPADIRKQYTDTFGKHIEFKSAKFKQQKDSVNCGVYLIENALAVSDTSIELAEFAENPAKYFKTQQEAEILETREAIAQVLNEASDDQYQVDGRGAITKVVVAPVNIDELPDKDQFVDNANEQIAKMLDEGTLGPEDFYKLFKAAEEAIKELNAVEESKASTDPVDPLVLNSQVRFFQQEHAKFQRELTKAKSRPSTPRSSCAIEAGKAVNESTTPVVPVF